jgi:tetratricopeptide (TPR) repeat protein
MGRLQESAGRVVEARTRPLSMLVSMLVSRPVSRENNRQTMLATILFTLVILGQERTAALPELPAIVVASYGEEARPQIREALKAAQRKQRDATAVGGLGRVLHAYEEYESAEVCYRRARGLRAETATTYLHGLVLVQLGRQAEAVAAFEAARELDPGYWQTRFRLAESFLAIGRLGEARQLYDRLAVEQPELALVHYGRGRLLAASREFGPAVTAYQRALAVSPYFGAAHYGLAMAYRETGQRELATEQLRQYQQYRLIRPFLTDRIEQEVLALNRGAAAHLRKGVEYESAGRLEEAIIEHEKARTLNPRFEQVRLNLLTLYARAGRIEKAEEEYRAIEALNPNLAESHYNYGVMKAERQDYVMAAAAFRRCLAINPHHPSAHYNLGRIDEIGQRYDDALDHYREAARLEPGNREARYQLARMLIFKGNLAAAIVSLQEALRPEDEATARYLYALAIAEARNGDRESAITHMRLARERANAFNQKDLLAAIERDLKVLETR